MKTKFFYKKPSAHNLTVVNPNNGEEVESLDFSSLSKAKRFASKKKIPLIHSSQNRVARVFKLDKQTSSVYKDFAKTNGHYSAYPGDKRLLDLYKKKPSLNTKKLHKKVKTSDAKIVDIDWDHL